MNTFNANLQLLILAGRTDRIRTALLAPCNQCAQRQILSCLKLERVRMHAGIERDDQCIMGRAAYRGHTQRIESIYCGCRHVSTIQLCVLLRGDSLSADIEVQRASRGNQNTQYDRASLSPNDLDTFEILKRL